ERLAEEDQPIRGDAPDLGEPAIGGARVPVRSFLVRAALAPTIAAIVKKEDGGAELRLQEDRPVESVAQVSRIAVGEEDRQPRLLHGEEEPVQLHSILGSEGNRLGGEAQVARGNVVAARRVVYELLLEEHREHQEQDGRKRHGPEAANGEARTRLDHGRGPSWRRGRRGSQCSKWKRASPPTSRRRGACGSARSRWTSR